MARLPIIEKLEEELKGLERELRVEVPKELKKAADHGDLRENAEYNAAKERQAFLQARISQLSERINSLSSLNLAQIPKDKVAFGSRVELLDLESDETKTFELVSPEEVDPAKGKISINSPIGRGLIGKREGDEVIISMPSGRHEYEVTSLLTLHDILKED